MIHMTYTVNIGINIITDTCMCACVCVANQERGGRQDLGRQGGKAGKRWWKWWGLAEGKDLLIRIIVP